MQHLTVNCSFSYTSWLQLAAESGCSSHCILTSPLMHWGASFISFQYCFSEKMFFVDVGAEILPSCGSLGLQPQNSHRTPGGQYIFYKYACLDPLPPSLLCIVRIKGQGGYKMGKSWVQNFLRPPSRQGKNVHAPIFKEWKLFVPPLQYG